MNHVRWQTDDWHLSHLLAQPAVREGLVLDHAIEISDCTLREGEQQAGVALGPEEKVELARALDELGIHQIEFSMPAISSEERRALEMVSRAELKAKIIAVCRATRADLDMAAAAGAWGAIVSLPISDLQANYKLHWSREKLLGTAVEMTRYAHEKGLYVVLSPYDTTRSDLDFLREYYQTAHRHGHVDRVRVVDTTGCITPEGMRYLVKCVRECISVPIEVHGHDDFGLANANIIAGLTAGAAVASTSMLGIGERAGNAATEEVAMALYLLYGKDIGLRWERLAHVCDLFARQTRVLLQPHKAVCGENAFAQVSGLVVAGFLENPFTAQPYRGRLVGRQEVVKLGKSSGKASIEWKLRQLGLSVTPEQIDALLNLVKEEGIHTKAAVPDHRFREMVRQVLGR